MIQSAERLGDILIALGAAAGSVTVLPIAPREGKDASRVVVAARKGGKAPLRLLAPFVLHCGPRHERDGDDYSAVARAVLRDGAAIAALAS